MTSVPPTSPARTAAVQTIATPDGPFTIVCAANGHVLASGWTDEPDELVLRIGPQQRPPSLAAAARRESMLEPAASAGLTQAASAGLTQAAAAVEAYYSGDWDAVTAVPVLQPGTALQQSGWKLLRDLPAGATMSYTEFATALRRPTAARAAAAVCARNAAALFVPCHRVLRGDGSLGGFAWGRHIKQSLLARESHPVTRT
ncbi:methylated-DNA--[protein]-cysteine S-methyltransferase [Brevibacterium luteolum]|uniref:methylated-DNA--[protein]-cysteine S-methyltransferase n=1 Tax=Brevibacterium luteolum TaxID=199591 RepID=UPI003B683DB9